MEIPQGWVQVTWSNPTRTCSQCGSQGNETGWRLDHDRDRGHFLCPSCGPEGGKKERRPHPVVKEVNHEGTVHTCRRGRPVGSKNKSKKA
jgi:predicted RNA-binding Zn-ribbon protein involved in translation (DUF1610 family)